ncbi:MAG: RHS repeat protein [Anaerolineales bacterium]|nr:RHS repeat protein [Anaerolineales bacterium]
MRSWAYSFDDCTVAQNLAEVDVDYLYDGLGRQIRTGVPHATTASWVNRAANWSDGYTSTQYDATGRVTQVTAYNGNVQDYYYGSRASWVIAKGRDGEGDRVVSWQQTDGLGKVRSVRSYNPVGTTGTWTVEGEVGLTHDVLGNLVAVHQPTGHTTTMTYDMAGRKLSMTDPDLGAWDYEYTRRGQLTKQTDACANVTALTYDALDRLRVQTVTAGNDADCRTTPAAGASVNYTYTYDVGQAALGQLTGVRASDGSYSKNLLYDADGRVRAEGIAIFGSINYTTSYTYDAYQRLVVTTYPGGEKVRVGYNSMGLPETLTSTAVISPLVSGVDYDAAGRPVTLNLAGGWLQRTQRYGPWNTSGKQGGQLLGITVTQGSSVVAALGYTYDAFGNVHTQQESGSTPLTFGYDDQHRLTSAYGQSYAYDSAGRMLLFEGGSNFTFDSVHPHAVNTVNGVDRYDYDANGNLIRRNKGLAASQVLTWTADNRLATVQSSTLTERYAYAPDGERIWKETNGAVTRTPFAHYEVEVASNTVTRYYSFGGQLIAMRQGSAQPTYLHTDALGSVVATSPVGGSTSALQRYCGYGRLRSAGSGGTWNCGTTANLFATDRTYTGQQADGTGLMYYHARYYDPAAGQFISPDTLVPDPTNVMDYKRYAYARKPAKSN